MQPINLILLVVVFSHIDLYIYAHKHIPSKGDYLFVDKRGRKMNSSTIALLNIYVICLYYSVFCIILYCPDMGLLGCQGNQGVPNHHSLENCKAVFIIHCI